MQMIKQYFFVPFLAHRKTIGTVRRRLQVFNLTGLAGTYMEKEKNLTLST